MPRAQEFIDVPDAAVWDVESEAAKALIKLALKDAYDAEKPGVRIRARPVRGVFANKPAAAKKIRLTPLTMTVVLQKPKGADATGRPRVERVLVFGVDKTRYDATLAAPRITLVAPRVPAGTSPKGDAPNLFGPPFWLVRTTADAAMANTQAGTVKAGVGLDNKASHLPFLTNSKPVREGEELLLYRKAKAAASMPRPPYPARARASQLPREKRPLAAIGGKKAGPTIAGGRAKLRR